MEESINPSPVPSNCTSPVCSDPAHDDLALDSEWSDEDRDCVGDGPHRVVEDPEDLDVPDVRVREDEDQEVQQVLLRFSGAHAPEILKVTCTDTGYRCPQLSKAYSLGCWLHISRGGCTRSFMY